MIRYYETAIKAGLKQRRKLTAFLQSLIHNELEVKKIDITYIFCDDDYLLEKNIRFLNHHTLTDIITFDLSETMDTLYAEIYISVRRVLENAAKFGVKYQDELHRVIFHGVLHLCGYKDKKKADQDRMRAMENQCLQQYFSSLED